MTLRERRTRDARDYIAELAEELFNPEHPAEWDDPRQVLFDALIEYVFPQWRPQ
jgi:hypothetical protein